MTFKTPHLLRRAFAIALCLSIAAPSTFAQTQSQQQQWQRQQQQQQQQAQQRQQQQDQLRQQQQQQQRQQMQEQMRRQMQDQMRQQVQAQQREQAHQQMQAQQREQARQAQAQQQRQGQQRATQQQTADLQRRQLQQQGKLGSDGKPTGVAVSGGMPRMSRPLTAGEIQRGFTGRTTADGRALIKYQGRVFTVPASRVAGLSARLAMQSQQRASRWTAQQQASISQRVKTISAQSSTTQTAGGTTGGSSSGGNSGCSPPESLTCKFNEAARLRIQTAVHAKDVASRDSQAGEAVGKDTRPLLWSSWEDYPKVSVNGRQYAKVGSRLYTEHAINRMKPSGLGAAENEDSPGRNISPNLVEDVIGLGLKEESNERGVSRTIYWSGNVGVVTENEGNLVVSILRRGSK